MQNFVRVFELEGLKIFEFESEEDSDIDSINQMVAEQPIKRKTNLNENNLKM